MYAGTYVVDVNISDWKYFILVRSNHNLFGELTFFCLFSALSFLYPRSPVLCFFYLYSFLLYVFSYNITLPQFRSTYLSVSTHFHLPCSHYYIFFSLSLHMTQPSQSHLHMAQPSQSHFPYFLTYVCHTCPCSYFFIPDLLNLDILISVLSSKFCLTFDELSHNFIFLNRCLLLVEQLNCDGCRQQ